MGVMITSRGAIQQSVTYVFVDASNLLPYFNEAIQAWAGKQVDLYVPGIRQLFSANKLFYYDSIDDNPKSGETSEQRDARIREHEATLRRINAAPNTHVRYGSVTGRDRRKRRQKEIDILIAVDMMNHAVRQNMDKAVLVSCDRDFTPLVETLVQLGLTVEVAGDFRYTSDVLHAAADWYRPLGLDSYRQFVEPHIQRSMPPLPSFSGGLSPKSGMFKASAEGICGAYSCRLIPRPKSSGFWFEMVTGQDARFTEVLTVEDIRRLSVFLQFQFGEAAWLDSFLSTLVP